MSESILEEAQRLIHGERNQNYGHPRENFKNIARLFSGYLDREISDIDVANLMILVKVARVQGGPYHRDSFTDIAGYAGCVGRIYEEDTPVDVALAKITEEMDQNRKEALWNPEPTWDKLEDVPEGVVVSGLSGSSPNTKFRMYEGKCQIWMDEDHWETTLFDPNIYGGFTEVSAPRVWDKVEDIPPGVIFTPRDSHRRYHVDDKSDLWILSEDGSGEWHLSNYDVQNPRFNKHHSPFTEVV